MNQGMYRVVTRVTFVQQPNATFPSRTRTLQYDFLSEFQCEDTWQELTNDLKLILPKNIYVRDANGVLVNLGGTNVNIGGFSNNEPLFMRGDKVRLQAGYRYFDAAGREQLFFPTIYEGYVRRVNSKKPIEVECEDNMYLLKQIIAVNQTYGAGTSLESILANMLKGTGLTVNVLTDTFMGEFTVHNETVSEVLARLQKDYHFYSYFRGTELRCGSLVYLEQDAIDAGRFIFQFQQNIISDDLQYNRTEDIELSAVAYSVNKIELDTIGKRGRRRTRHVRLEVLVTLRNGRVTSYIKPQGSRADYAPATSGERRTLYFWNVTTTDRLVALAAAELKKYYYSGLKGKFTTFIMPLVRQGYNVDILDPVLPERNGRYKVRSVKYNGGTQGLRQEIELDYLITRLDINGNVVN